MESRISPRDSLIQGRLQKVPSRKIDFKPKAPSPAAWRVKIQGNEEKKGKDAKFYGKTSAYITSIKVKIIFFFLIFFI